MKKVLITGALIFGVAAMANAAKKEDRTVLRSRLIDHINNGQDSIATKETFAGKVHKMTMDEVETLYKFMITYKGSWDFLPVPLRVATREVVAKYNLF